MRGGIRLVLGTAAVIGGGLGIVILIPLLGVGSRLGFPGESLLFLVFALYVYGIWGGVGALSDRKSWRTHAKYFWLCQVPAFSSPALAYFVSSGAGFWVYARVSPLGAGAHAYLGSTVQFAIGKGDPGFAIGVNLLALGVAFLIHQTTPNDTLSLPANSDSA
jgi:hypothetical protein